MKVDFLNLRKINMPIFPLFIWKLARYLFGGGYYINGKAKAQFESNLGDYLGCQNVIGTGNGLDALTIGFMSLVELGYLKKGDRVLVQNNTFIASYNAILFSGLVPVLFDLEKGQALITVNALKNVSLNGIKAVLIVHLYGHASIDSEIINFTKVNNILVVEDCAQSIGTSYNGQFCGTFGVFSAFSFYPGKNLGAIGDGGAIVTQNKELAFICRSISNYGSQIKYFHNYLGINSRLDDIQALFLDIKLKKLKHENSCRITQARIYENNIRNNNIRIIKQPVNSRSTYHLFVIIVETRDHFIEYMKSHGIECLIHYPITISEQSFVKLNGFGNTVDLAKKIVSIPIGSHLTKKQVMFVCEKMNTYLYD